jgi:mono/diheme cytochrome c family protein
MRHLYANRLVAPLIVLLVACAAGCSSEAADEDIDDAVDAGADAPEDRPVTYHQDIKPILDERCAECHVPDGAGPYPLDTYEDATAHAQLALAAIEAGIMPPWPADPSCRSYIDERLMPDAEKELLREWIDADMPEGTPVDEEPADDQDDLGAPDITASPMGAYTPDDGRPDDYRCFLLDAEFDQETYMVGSTVMPDDIELVHHADIFVVNPFQVDAVEQLEADHDGAGYPCFGDPGFDSITLLGAWVPGARPIFLPDDSAAVIPEGARLVLQTHFNTLYADPKPVQPEFHLWTRDDAPSERIWAMPFANLNFTIPAGESDSVHTLEFKNRSQNTWNVLGAAAHMHLLGVHFRLDVEREDDSEPNACLLDIPEWDFDWQQVYRFREGEDVDVAPGDTVRLTCSFDNSPEKQPVIDGERQQPREVSWGGKTTDEMCLGFLVVSEPYEAKEAGEGLCSAFEDCREDCDDPYGIECLFNCATVDLTCGQCLLTATQSCSSQYCPDETREAAPCVVNCGQAAQAGGDIDACLREECPDERDELEACIRPRIEGGHCNVYLADCDVEL